MRAQPIGERRPLRSALLLALALTAPGAHAQSTDPIGFDTLSRTNTGSNARAFQPDATVGSAFQGGAVNTNTVVTPPFGQNTTTSVGVTGTQDRAMLARNLERACAEERQLVGWLGDGTGLAPDFVRSLQSSLEATRRDIQSLSAALGVQPCNSSTGNGRTTIGGVQVGPGVGQRGTAVDGGASNPNRNTPGTDNRSWVGVGDNSNTGPSGVRYLSRERVKAAIEDARGDISRGANRLWPDGADQNPFSDATTMDEAALIDAVLDIKDDQLRARMFRGLVAVTSSSSGQNAYIELLMAISAKGHDRASLADSEIQGKLQAFESAARIPARDPNQRVAELARASGLDLATYQRTVAAVLDRAFVQGAQNDPELRAAVRSIVIVQHALALVARYDQPIHNQNLQTQWQAHIQALGAYVRKAGIHPASLPAGGGAISRVGPPGTGPALNTGNGTTTGTGSTWGQNGTIVDGGTTVPNGGITNGTVQPSDPTQAQSDLARFQALRGEIHRRLRRVIQLVKSDRWTESNDLYELIQWANPWDDGDPAEELVKEFGEDFFNRTRTTPTDKSVLFPLEELARVERRMAQENRILPTTGNTPQALAGREQIMARKDAVTVLSVAFRFEKKEYKNLDETHDPIQALKKLYIDVGSGDRPSLRFGDAKAWLEEGLVDDMRDDCKFDKGDMVRTLDVLARYFRSNDADVAAARRALTEDHGRWQRCDNTGLFDWGSPLFNLIKVEYDAVVASSDPARAYRLLILQEILKD